MLAAQGYQESQLNQDAKSHVGAMGGMQLMPATGAETKVGDVKVTEANILGPVDDPIFPRSEVQRGESVAVCSCRLQRGPGANRKPA